MRLDHLLVLSLFVTGCASAPKAQMTATDSSAAKASAVQPVGQASVAAPASDLSREPGSIALHRSALSIVGGIRILNLGSHNDGMLTILRDRNSSQPIRVKCVAGLGHPPTGTALELDFGDDSASKTLDLNHATIALAPQATMSACLVLMDKLLETTQFYPAYVNFIDDHKIKVSF